MLEKKKSMSSEDDILTVEWNGRWGIIEKESELSTDWVYWIYVARDIESSIYVRPAVWIRAKWYDIQFLSNPYKLDFHLPPLSAHMLPY